MVSVSSTSCVFIGNADCKSFQLADIKIMEYPTSPSRYERRKQRDVSIVIKGLQDIALQASVERIEQISEALEDGYNYDTLQRYVRGDYDNDYS